MGKTPKGEEGRREKGRETAKKRGGKEGEKRCQERDSQGSGKEGKRLRKVVSKERPEAARAMLAGDKQVLSVLCVAGDVVRSAWRQNF